MKCIGWQKNFYVSIKSFEDLFLRKVTIQICALGPCLVASKIPKLYKISPSHQIFEHMHEVLNVTKQNN